MTDASSERSCMFAVDSSSTTAHPPIAATMKPTMAASMTLRKRGIVFAGWRCTAVAVKLNETVQETQFRPQAGARVRFFGSPWCGPLLKSFSIDCPH